MSDTVSALTLWQPYAQLIVEGSKKFETRSWSTGHRGPLLIHAAKRYAKQERVDTGWFFHREHLDTTADEMPLGCLIGVCRVVEAWPSGHPALRAMTTKYEHEFGDFRPGRYAWELEDVRRFDEPVPWRGRQGLWSVPANELPEHVQDLVREVTP